MAGTVTVSASLKVVNGNLQYQSQPTSYTASQATANGPAPGSVVATTAGVNVSFAALTLPGFVIIRNLDATNYVTWGLYDGTTFRPVGELQPGESHVLRFARTLLTANAAADVVRLVANSANCNVQVQCFDS